VRLASGAPGPCGFAVQKYTNGVLDKILRPHPSNTNGTMYLTVDFNANPPVVYAVTTAFNPTMDQNAVVKVVDDGSATGTATLLATAGVNECFRGISFGPNVLTPAITANQLPDGNLRLTVSGSSNISYSVESTPVVAPTSWTSRVTNSSSSGTFIYDDLTATNSAHRYYRATYRP